MALEFSKTPLQIRVAPDVKLIVPEFVKLLFTVRVVKFEIVPVDSRFYAVIVPAETEPYPSSKARFHVTVNLFA